ncbi:MAG: IgGFc-binding protein, partial [Dysgonamonadaceae bacterium]|nr:IgGFc-binding protein [Dysgonamonadaceae bacterium]
GGTSTYKLSLDQKTAVFNGSSPLTGVSNLSVHITSTDSIAVYAISQVNASTDATNVLPVSTYGMDYYHLGYKPLFINPDYDYDGYCVIAQENGTDIYVNGVQTPVATLNKGQVYHSYATRDLTGNRLSSNKPVAYFVMISGVNIPDGSGYSDCMFQQLPPVKQWGKRFVVPNTVQTKGRIRVVAAYNGTTLTQSGATLQTSPGKGSLSLNAGEFAEFEILNGNGCYIQSNQPVGVCSYLVSGTYTGLSMADAHRGDPAEAWVAPIEQTMPSVLMAPFVPTGTSQLTYHYALIVTPTNGKANTTASINGNAPTNISSSITWKDNVGGSGYSFGSYPLNNSSYLFSNPNKLFVSGYGMGAAESYYYLAGSAAIDLAADFTVNNEPRMNVEGKSLCGITDFECKATFQGQTPSSITWKLDGQVVTAYQNQAIATITILSKGLHTISMTIPAGINGEKTISVSFYVGGPSIVWTPEANTSGSNADKQNWDLKQNWTPNIVPTDCNDVYIPGNCTHYPQLTKAAACQDIYFIQGGELGRPDLLTYNHAYVHLNFDLKQSAQQKETNVTTLRNLVLNSQQTADRLKFSSSTSTPLARERWYALSAPLRNTVSGDFSFGGFPLTFMKKFGPVQKDGANYPVGTWTTPYTSLTEPLNVTEGFGFYMYGYGNASGDNTGCEESGFFSDLNDLSYLPSSLSGQSYGIQQVNGILEFPFYSDTLNREAHRIQDYDPATQQSTFYYISDGSIGAFNTFTGNNDFSTREDNRGAYRFITEDYQTNRWVFANPVYHTSNGLNAGDVVLVGNPYMSSIDMVSFCADNAASISPEFRIWNGTTFESYSVNTSTGNVTPTVPTNSRYVAPMQGFFLTYQSGDIRFDVTKISKVRPINTPANLRSAEQPEENLLRIKAENDAAISYTVICHRAEADNAFVEGEDVQKLFSSYGKVPEIYSLAGETPLDINFFDQSEETIVPLGIKTQKLGKITLTFTGMDHYTQADKIFFIDQELNEEIDLSQQASVSYSFNNQLQGIQNGRFFLRFLKRPTSVANIYTGNFIEVYGNASGITVGSRSSDPIRKITVYDLQGNLLYEETPNHTSLFHIQKDWNVRQVIVRVVTEKQTKSIKVLLTK